MDINVKSPQMPTPWRTVYRFAAWMLLAALAIVTIGPISQRPLTLLPVNLERFIAWVCVGAIFAAAYIDRLLLLPFLLVGAAGLFELGQFEVLQRHARLADFVVKAAGGLVGIGSIRAIRFLYVAK